MVFNKSGTVITFLEDEILGKLNNSNEILNCWISPKGKIYECGICEHNTEAAKIIRDSGWEEDYFGLSISINGLTSSDYLADIKYFVRFQTMFPDSEGHWIFSKDPTKEQLERMWQISKFIFK